MFEVIFQNFAPFKKPERYVMDSDVFMVINCDKKTRVGKFIVLETVSRGFDATSGSTV